MLRARVSRCDVPGSASGLPAAGANWPIRFGFARFAWALCSNRNAKMAGAGIGLPFVPKLDFSQGLRHARRLSDDDLGLPTSKLEKYEKARRSALARHEEEPHEDQPQPEAKEAKEYKEIDQEWLEQMKAGTRYRPTSASDYGRKQCVRCVARCVALMLCLVYSSLLLPICSRELWEKWRLVKEDTERTTELLTGALACVPACAPALPCSFVHKRTHRHASAFVPH